MLFCAAGTKKHCKGLTIDGIFGNVYTRLELHVCVKTSLVLEKFPRTNARAGLAVIILLVVMAPVFTPQAFQFKAYVQFVARRT